MDLQLVKMYHLIQRKMDIYLMDGIYMMKLMKYLQQQNLIQMKQLIVIKLINQSGYLILSLQLLISQQEQIIIRQFRKLLIMLHKILLMKRK